MSHLPVELTEEEIVRVREFMSERVISTQFLLRATEETRAYWESNQPYVRTVVVGWIDYMLSLSPARLLAFTDLAADLRGGGNHPL